MPILLNLLGRFWYVIPIVGLFLWGEWWHHEAKDIKKDLAVYQAQVDTAAAKAETAKVLKEKASAEQIAVAVNDRNAALARVRIAEAAAASSRGRVPLTPAAPAGSNQICFEPVAFAAAIERYRQRVAGVIGQGDEAQVDAQTLLKAWPK